MKDHIKGVHWESIEEAENAVLSWCQSNAVDFYRNGLESWRHRMEKCFLLDGAYVEK